MYKQYSANKHKINRTQLPNIYKNSKQSQQISMYSKADETTSLIDKQYDQMSNLQIKTSTKSLKAKIIEMNKKINYILQKQSTLRIKSLDKPNLTKEEQQSIIQKQEQNNQKVFDLYRRELQQLDERKQNIKGSTKNNTLSSIMETQQKILNIKILLKQMKKKMHTKEKSIVQKAENKKQNKNTNLLKQLQQDYITTTAKMNQMRLKIEQIQVKSQRLKIQNKSLLQQYKQADETIQIINEKQEQYSKNERMHSIYRNKLNQLQSSKRRLANTKTNGEQKYLTKLKDLQNLTNLKSSNKNIQKVIKDSVQMIKGLEEILLEQQIEISEKIKRQAIEIKTKQQSENKQQKDRVSLVLHESQETAREETFNEDPKQQQVQHQNKQQQQQNNDEEQCQKQDQQQQVNKNSMFLTMPQQSKRNTVYKKNSIKNDQDKHIQSNRTVSLRYVQPKQKLTQRQITSAVTQVNEAVQSINNLFDSFAKKPRKEPDIKKQQQKL